MIYQGGREWKRQSGLKIQAKDMKGFFQKAYIYYMGWHDGWYEVYYIPPNALDGKDAIYGYIHNSQIKKRTQ